MNGMKPAEVPTVTLSEYSDSDNSVYYDSFAESMSEGDDSDYERDDDVPPPAAPEVLETVTKLYSKVKKRKSLYAVEPLTQQLNSLLSSHLNNHPTNDVAPEEAKIWSKTYELMGNIHEEFFPALKEWVEEVDEPTPFLEEMCRYAQGVMGYEPLDNESSATFDKAMALFDYNFKELQYVRSGGEDTFEPEDVKTI